MNAPPSNTLAILNARLLDPASNYDGPGAVLVEDGRITPAQLEDALLDQAERRRLGRPLLLGELLIERSLITEAQLADALRRRARSLRLDDLR